MADLLDGPVDWLTAKWRDFQSRPSNADMLASASNKIMRRQYGDEPVNALASGVPMARVADLMGGEDR